MPAAAQMGIFFTYLSALGLGFTPFDRITSYNVCYTKLLRWHRADLAAVAILPRLRRPGQSAYGGGCRRGLSGGLRDPGADRITSYNVCYTKLLRIGDVIEVKLLGLLVRKKTLKLDLTEEGKNEILCLQSHILKENELLTSALGVA